MMKCSEIRTLQCSSHNSDGLHSTMNVLRANKLYIFNWLIWQILCSMNFYRSFFFFLKKDTGSLILLLCLGHVPA